VTESAIALDPSVVPARYWHRLPDGRLQCDVCPRFCKLHEDQRGLCFVRARQGERMVLTTYGRSSGFCIDPIEKKPLAHFLPGTSVLSFGTAGCNLTCKFCQNWDISKSRELDTLADAAAPEALARAAKALGCRSVAFTYNDPTVFLEYAVDTAAACREAGIKSVMVSAGYVAPEARHDLYRHADAANIDLKSFNEAFYRKICGAHLGDVLETLQYLVHETRCWTEITTLIIPDENDSSGEIEAMSRWIADKLGPDVPIHFSAFHPDYKMLDRQPTSKETLIRARDIAMKNGLRYVYVGNVHHEAGDSTYCHGCGTRIIGRDWYEITAWNLTDKGECRSCGVAPLDIAVEAADELGLPLMAHLDRPPPSRPEVLDRLRPGDVLTHCFRPFPSAPVHGDGSLRAEIAEARARGILFDIGHGGGSFGFRSARSALAAGFEPDIISSDVHQLSIDGPAFDLLVTMSKMLCLGMSLPRVIEATTIAPARALRRPELGTLKPGSAGDASVLSLDSGSYDYIDVINEHLQGEKRLFPSGMVVGGQWVETTR
jgi:pyruvate formate lyase activating enzyme